VVAPVPEPRLDAEQVRQLHEGVRQFNEGLYFECHDTLEEMWGGVRGPSRDFFQGLIQVSVAHYHLGRGNLAGAESMFGRALKRFAPYPASYFGFDLDAERRKIEGRLEQIRSGSFEGAPADAPSWRFEPRPVGSREP
jgi:predicted metal-dependent hydrolase